MDDSGLPAGLGLLFAPASCATVVGRYILTIERMSPGTIPAPYPGTKPPGAEPEKRKQDNLNSMAGI